MALAENGAAGGFRRIDPGSEAATTLEVSKPDGEAVVTFTPALDDAQLGELTPVVEMSKNQTELKDDLSWLARRWHRKLAIKPR